MRSGRVLNQPLRTAAVVVLTLLAAGSAEGHVGVLDGAGPGPATAYAQSLASAGPPTSSQDPRVRGGAAARALECAAAPAGGERGLPSTGLYAGASSRAAALQQVVRSAPWVLPQSGWRQEVREGDRVLFSFDVQGATKAAVVVVDDDDPSTYADHWVGETAAWCDVSEYPADLQGTGAAQVWRDAAGRRVPTTVVRSYYGAQHCRWQDVTFLEVDGRQFARDPHDRLRGLLHHPGYSPTAQLADDALETTYSRAGARLYLADAAAYVVDGARVERWPETLHELGCM